MTAIKVILHSDQSPEKTGALDAKLIVSLTGKRAPRMGYMPSAHDARRKNFDQTQRYYEKIGFSKLQCFDADETVSSDEIQDFFSNDVIHLPGGHVCLFRERLRTSGCDEHLKGFARRGGVLIGVSAGAMLLGATFQSAALFGEKGAFDGIGLFEFEIVPHVAEHFPRLDRIQAFANRIKRPVYAMNDGDVLVLTGSKIKTHGSPQLLVPSGA